MADPIDDPMATSRADAEALDENDPLKGCRDEFVIVDPELVYLDGNSLGMTPKRTIDALRVAMQHWAGDLITSWWERGWLELPFSVGDRLGPLLGSRPGEIAVHDSTTVGLFQLVNVALDLEWGPPVIAVPSNEFPTDRYVADGIGRLRDVEVRRGVRDLDGVGVVVRSLVDYRTAELVDLAAETARAADAGATTVWDLSHAVGAVELDLPAAGVELAVGCTYKFLNGGPGAPAFTYVTEELHERIVQPIWGWFGQTDQFVMHRAFDPRPGIGRLLHGTPGVLGLVAAGEGIALSAETGIDRIAEKARRMTGFGLVLAEEAGLDTVTPRDPRRRGAHVAIRHPDAERLHRELAKRKVIVDHRDPDILRLGMSPLTTRFTDVHDAITAIAELA